MPLCDCIQLHRPSRHDSSVAVDIIGNLLAQTVFNCLQDFCVDASLESAFGSIYVDLSLSDNIDPFLSQRLVEQLAWRQQDAAQTQGNGFLEGVGPTEQEEDGGLDYLETVDVLDFVSKFLTELHHDTLLFFGIELGIEGLAVDDVNASTFGEVLIHPVPLFHLLNDQQLLLNALTPVSDLGEAVADFVNEVGEGNYSEDLDKRDHSNLHIVPRSDVAVAYSEDGRATKIKTINIFHHRTLALDTRKDDPGVLETALR